jgi:hypothetical protein
MLAFPTYLKKDSLFTEEASPGRSHTALAVFMSVCATYRAVFVSEALPPRAGLPADNRLLYVVARSVLCPPLVISHTPRRPVFPQGEGAPVPTYLTVSRLASGGDACWAILIKSARHQSHSHEGDHRRWTSPYPSNQARRGRL